MKQGKKYVDSVKLIDSTKAYDSSEALDLVCQTAKAKFDETVELHVRLGVDSRHADQQVRGAVVLPNGTGKTVRTLVFAKGEKIMICGIRFCCFLVWSVCCMARFFFTKASNSARLLIE